jgi:hypothetical protein
MAESPRITDAAVAELRRRVGLVEPQPTAPHYRVPNEDAFRTVAWSYGDDNQLWSQGAYAGATPWEGVIAPPPLVGGDSLIGEDAITDAERAARSERHGDPLRGVHAFYSSSEREWWAPLRPGRRVVRKNALVGVLDKHSDFARRAVHEWTAMVFQERDGPLLGAQFRNMVRTERAAATERKKYDHLSPTAYSDDEIEAIDAAYAAHRRRGAAARWWEDVSVGDVLGPMVKGPLTVTDIVCWHVGMGMGVYSVSPLELAFRNRQRIPRFYHRDELNIPDVMQRVHWDPEFARRSGNPTTFDYGRMRETWLIHLCTDWMGDAAWLHRLSVEFRGFNYVGDTHWVSGEVVRRYLDDDGRLAIDVRLEGRNQRGVVTTPGSATILLPSREHGPVRLPVPPSGATDLDAALAAIVERFDRR